MQAQEKPIISAIEKIYLHTDRSIYFVGEDLWYKAYDVNANTNLLSDNSNVLYVELISPDSKIILKNKTNLEVGLGNGDFQLKDSLDIKPGHYQLRAYTNWNRNFGDDFVFKKDIEIINVFDGNFNPKKAQDNAKNKFVKSLGTGIQNTAKVDFFPEGGSLIENVASVVGFKAVDSNGNPIDIKGEIYDSNNELVTSFESVHDGMGKLQMVPIEGKKYFAKLKSPTGEEIKVDLPNVLKQGYLLSYRVFKGKNIITIFTNPETLSQNPNAEFTVVCKSRGVTYFEIKKKLSETTLSFELPKDKTPEGISQITLFDSNSKPQSERLVYIEKEHDLEVQLTTNKSSYKPAEKASINITSKTKSGEAKSASFSVSVTDRNGEVEDKDFGTNICSYFLMESDIKGKVYNPAYYFDSANLKRLEHLDNLLLTQGWRDFLWKIAPKMETDFKVEKGFTISGSVKQMFGSKPSVNNKLTLTLRNKKQMNLFGAVTDSIGRFQFENLMFSGKTTMFLNNRNEKGKFGGEIVLDPIEQAALPIFFQTTGFDWSERTRSIAQYVFKKYIGFGIDPENMLNEVAIVGKKKNVTIYGVPDYSYKADENTAKLLNIYDVLGEVPNVNVTIDNIISVIGESGSPIILVDNDIATKEVLEFINSEEVIKIEVARGDYSVYYILEEGINGAGGLISIFTKGTRMNRPKKESVHAFSKEIEGFYTARVFYAPNPEKPNPELDNKVDVRNTLYWNPYVHPNNEGNVTVNYYNSILETKVKVTLEGITGSGIPIVKKAYYTIKK